MTFHDLFGACSRRASRIRTFITMSSLRRSARRPRGHGRNGVSITRCDKPVAGSDTSISDMPHSSRFLDSQFIRSTPGKTDDQGHSNYKSHLRLALYGTIYFLARHSHVQITSNGRVDTRGSKAARQCFADRPVPHCQHYRIRYFVAFYEAGDGRGALQMISDVVGSTYNVIHHLGVQAKVVTSSLNTTSQELWCAGRGCCSLWGP